VNLPRLILADEIKPGVVPLSLMLVYVLKRNGFKVKVFTCGRSEMEIRLLKLLMGERIISLDSFACGSTKNLKTLFQSLAEPDALNVILAPLGKRQEEDFIQVAPDVTDIAKVLSCGVIPVIFASTSAILTTNAALSALSALESAYKESVLGVIFTSVKNPREYQLLEQEFGRRTHILSLGYTPKEIERSLTSLQDLYSSAAGVMQVKSAALQLASSPNQVEWEILNAFGHLKKDWEAPEKFPAINKNFKTAIVGSQAWALEGDNCHELFKLLGCEVVDYDPLQEPFPRDVEAIYFPHSAANLYADKLLAHEPFRQGIKQSFVANKLIFVNGASTALFGQSFISVDGKKHDALNFFKFRGSYSSMKPRESVTKVEIRGIASSIFTKPDEKIRGYALDYLSISNPGNVVPPMWAYRDVRKDTELGLSGWVIGYCFVTDLYVDLWSNTEIVNRWLSLRKR